MDKKFNHIRKNEEFEEEDVWSVLKQVGDTKPKSGSTQQQKPISITSKKFPSAARMIRVPSGSVSGSGGSTGHQLAQLVQLAQSAPVNVPDWSKMNVSEEEEDEDEDDDDEDGDSMIPPHEWVARKQGKREMMSFSVCEGAGRTLKGRDLRKVRYAVLTRTGFLEQ